MIQKKPVRVAYLVSHPIQYQAPLLRQIAQEPDIDLTVFFASDFSLREYHDVGFGTRVEWDTPLLAGYRYEFLPSLRDRRRTGITTQINYGIFSRLRGTSDHPAYDALWLHGYSTINAWQAILAAKALGIPVMLRAESWLRSTERAGIKQLFKAAFFKLLKGFIAATLPIGSHNQAYWRSCFGDEMPQFPMPYAVDNEHFKRHSEQAAAQESSLRAEFGLEAARPIILFASKLQPRKRCRDLIAAYQDLSSGTGLAPAAYLLIVGDGQERSSLESLAATFHSEGIRFCGFRNQSELPKFFAAANIFVLPSEHEPWGLVVNEAMNAGCPVVVSDGVGCQPDLVTDGVEGFVFPAGDVPALTRALRRLLAAPELATRMGQHARDRIEQVNFESDVQGLRSALANVTRRIEP